MIGSVQSRGGREPCHRAAFTLLEMLVAMAIMLVIMLMMATIFHQSNMAWTTGFREVDMSMQGRSALNLIGEELSDALADSTLMCQLSSGDPSLMFWTQGRPTEATRGAYLVRYIRSGDSIERTVWDTPVGGGYPRYNSPKSATLVDHVADFSVTLPTGGTYTTNLPPWVELSLVLEKTDENASIRVRSLGRDKRLGTKDDVRSWKDSGDQ